MKWRSSSRTVSLPRAFVSVRSPSAFSTSSGLSVVSTVVSASIMGWMRRSGHGYSRPQCRPPVGGEDAAARARKFGLSEQRRGRAAARGLGK